MPAEQGSTDSADPADTAGADIILILCDDPGWCNPACFSNAEPTSIKLRVGRGALSRSLLSEHDDVLRQRLLLPGTPGLRWVAK